MPSWRASALAEFRVAVLGASAHWTMDLRLYLEAFEGCADGVARVFGAGWFAVVGGGGLGGVEGGPKERLLFFRPLRPPSGRWVSLSCVSNAPLHNLCNS